MNTKTLFFCIILPALFAGCSKDCTIQLPPNKSELVAECYLEDGQPLRALISESTGLLDTSTVPPVLVPAVVIVSHGNVKEYLVAFFLCG